MLLDIKDFRIRKEIIKQFKDLNFKSNRIFFSAYAKLFKKIQAILKEKKLDLMNVSFEELQDLEYDLKISFSHDEIKSMIQNNRVRKETIDNLMKKMIKLNLTITDTSEDKIVYCNIFNEIVDNRKDKRIYFNFNESVLKILYGLQAGNFINVEYEKLLELEDNYQLNFYLYCLTIFRNQSDGHITKNINDLKNELAGAFNYEDRLFYSRFISVPAKEINKNLELFGIEIKTFRNGDNIKIFVNRINGSACGAPLK